MTRRVWPFKPLQPTIESLQWATDIFQAKATEQRIALREQPSRIFNMAHILSDHWANYARVLIRNAQGGDGFYAPDWTQATKVGAVSSGTGVTIAAHLDDVYFNDRALLWQSPGKHEVVGITWDSNGVTGDVVNNYDNARLMPAWEADAPDGLSITRLGAQNNAANISFILSETADLAGSLYPQYRDHDVITDCPVTGGNAFDETIGFTLSTFDSPAGDQTYLRSRDIPEVTFQMRWHLFTRAEVFALRQWLHSRRGRQKAFWLSSHARDLTPATDLSATTINVFNDVLARPAPFDLEVVTNTGTFRMQVTSVAAGSPVNGRPTVDLTTSTSLNIPASDVRRISYLMFARFDADRIELNHAKGTEVQVPCREVPLI